MNNRKQSFWLMPKGWAAFGLIGAVSYFVWMEHRQHLFEWLPYVVILLCPMMHYFMHRNHHGGHTAHHQSGDEAAQRDQFHPH